MINFDVFISYSTQDKAAADAACAALENAGVRCWIAPRDITPGTDWGESILDALDHCRAMVLIFSASANSSPQIRREIERAVNRGVPVLPVRIEDIVPTKALAYFMGPVHWLDAMTPPLDQHLRRLAEVARTIMRAAPQNADADTAQAEATAATREASTLPVGHPMPAPPPEPRPAAPSERAEEPARKAQAATSIRRSAIAIAAIVALLVVGFGIWALVTNRLAPTVVAAGQLIVSGPDTASFEGPQGGPFNPARVSFEIRAAGSGFDWTIDGSVPRWVNVAPNQGHLGDNSSIQVSVEPTPSAQTLSQGQYEGQLLFKNLSNGAVTARTVRLAVAPRPPPAGELTVSGPDTLVFTGPQGGPFSPPRISFDVKAVGSGFDWLMDGAVPGWVTVTPGQGHLDDNGSRQVTAELTALARTLPPGQYEGQFSFRRVSGSSATARTVRLVVAPRPTAAAGELTVSGPAALLFTGLQGGPFGPPQIVLGLKAVGSGFKWSLEEAPGWLDVQPRQGELGADGSAELTLAPSPAADRLSGGRHNGQIKFKNMSSGVVVMRPVEIRVIGRPQLPGIAPTTTSPESLTGTKWRGTTTFDELFELDFQPDHKLRYHTRTGWWEAIWSQNGNAVHLEMNNKYSEYDGKLEGNRIEGTGKNKNGTAWTWSVTRQ